jgi:hypothetical protein
MKAGIRPGFFLKRIPPFFKLQKDSLSFIQLKRIYYFSFYLSLRPKIYNLGYKVF